METTLLENSEAAQHPPASPPPPPPLLHHIKTPSPPPPLSTINASKILSPPASNSGGSRSSSQEILKAKRSKRQSSIDESRSSVGPTPRATYVSWNDDDAIEDRGRKISVFDPATGQTQDYVCFLCYTVILNLIGFKQIGNCIGRGHFGSVYRGLNLATGEVVAIKRIKYNESNQKEIESIMVI